MQAVPQLKIAKKGLLIVVFVVGRSYLSLPLVYLVCASCTAYSVTRQTCQNTKLGIEPFVHNKMIGFLYSDRGDLSFLLLAVKATTKAK